MQKDKNTYITLIAIFALLLPALYLFGAIDINSVTLWGRYLCFAIAAIGVDLIWGYTGIMSMCQAFFFCLGAYGMGMYLTLHNLPEGETIPQFMTWCGVEQLPLFWKPFQSFIPAILTTIVATSLFALTSNFIFKRRIKGVFIAIITQALALAMFLLFSRNETLLGGSNGLTNFQHILGFNLRDENVKLALYLITVAALIAIYWGGKKLSESKFGKILVGIRDSESRLRFTGYRVSHFQTAIFVIGALIAMVAGMLYIPQTGIVTPGRMDVAASIEMLIWVAFGGRGNLKGAIVGALIVNLLYSVFTSLMPDAWPYILGVLYVVTALYLNKGILGVVNNLLKKMKKRGNLTVQKEI